MTEKPLQLDSVAPILSVPDVVAAVDYYKNVLGFPRSWTWGEPPCHAGVHWGKAAFQFTEQKVPTGTPRDTHAVFLRGVDTLYEQQRANGAEILSPLEAKSWGIKEYTVRDLNGYLLRFGEFCHEKNEARQGLPDHFRVVREPPPLADYERLIHAVGWANFSNFELMPRILENLVGAVTAYDGEAVVGCALLSGDHATYFYVRDVMVQPEYQGRGIGTALMSELMALVHEIAPANSMINLLTGGSMPSFYERFGFLGPEYLIGMSQRLGKASSP